MEGMCHEGMHWDPLVRRCMHCNLVCQHLPVITKCSRYCQSAQCKAMPGHYYDMLLKKCMRCADICGNHPAQCSQHCQPAPPVTIKTILTKVHNSGGLSVTTALEDSNILLYSLLALCMVLVVSSLSLALAVFPRKSRARPSNSGAKEANSKKECMVKSGKVGLPCGQQSVRGPNSSSRPTDCEPSDDSSPTETCVCVHCFPDLKTLGQVNARPPRAPFAFYQQAVLHKPETPKGSSLWPEEGLYSTGLEVQEEAVVV